MIAPDRYPRTYPGSWVCLDIGNTDTVGALYRPGQPLESVREIFRFPTSAAVTPWTARIRAEIDSLPEVPGRIVISNVVPARTPELGLAISEFNILWVMIGYHREFEVDLPSPERLGADRLANTAAALTLSQSPLIIVDAGTATKFCLIDALPAHIGGAIAPGIGIGAESIADRTPHLPRVDLVHPESVLGRSTESQIQSGLIFGHESMIHGMIDRFKKIPGFAQAQVIATGGWSGRLKFSPEIKIVPNLTLMGIARYGQLN